MSCLTEERLLDVHVGDATPDDRRHLAACTGCAERLAALARDTSRMSAVLRGVPPTRRRATRAWAWAWAPVAAAAMVALAIGLSPNPASLHDVDPLTLADELASLFDVETLDDDAAETTTTAASTCPWGDPLLEVGCDEPTVMQIAWR